MAGLRNLAYGKEKAAESFRDPSQPNRTRFCQQAAELLILKRRRKPQHLIGKISGLVTEQKRAEAEDQFPKGDLVSQEDSGVSATS